MNEDFLENAIEKAFKRKIDKPDEYENVIRNALNNKQKLQVEKGIIGFKKVACLLVVLLLATSCIFIKDISAFIGKYLLKINSNEGIQEAIDNGYIQEVDMQYVNSKGVNIKIKEVLMDDFNLLILFNIEISEIESIESIYNIKIDNLVITDENDNVIVLKLENSSKYKEFYEQRNIETTSNNIACNNGAFYGEIVTRNDKSLEYKYITHSEKFPKSRELNISFDKIILESKNSNETTIIEGKWNFELVLPEKMYNRETIVYNATECNKDNIIVTKAQVSNTEMKIELITEWGEPVYTERDSEEEKNKKIEDFFNKSHSLSSILIQNEYVVNEKGIKYYPVINDNDGNGGYNKMLNGKLKYWQTFELTKYDATDELKVVIEMQGEKVEIKLQNKI